MGLLFLCKIFIDMNLRKIIREEVGNDVVFEVLGNEYIIIRNNELKPYRKNYITEEEYDQLETFMNSIGIELRKFNYFQLRSNEELQIYSMRFKLRDEMLKKYIEIMGSEPSFDF